MIILIASLLLESTPADTLFGGTRTLINVGGYTGFVIQPPRAAADGSKPWAWYAPTFINQYPNLSNAWYFFRLIQQGFWVVGIDVGESYGSPAGCAAFSAFYDTLIARYHLNPKACLVPQSRGGLMLYNWAATGTNAQKVSRIAGIYPVGDLRSYPGLNTACGAYGMTAQELQTHLTEYNPMDRLQPLKNAGIKIMHIHGDADNVVPLSQNSQVIRDRYVAMGGEMTLIVIPGHGHEEIAQYFQNQQMLNFMLADLPTSVNPSPLASIPLIISDNYINQSGFYNVLGQRIMSEEKLSVISHQILFSEQQRNGKLFGMMHNLSIQGKR